MTYKIRKALSAAQKESINCYMAKNYPHTKEEVTKQIVTTEHQTKIQTGS